MPDVDPPPSRDEIVLMGPVCAGKTTVGRIVAERLGAPFADVDDVSDAYVRESDELDAAEWERLDAESLLASYRYAEAAIVGALERFTREHHGGVFALGAGHSSVLRDDLTGRVAAALAPFRHRVLLLPSSDPAQAAAVLRRRCEQERGGPERDGGWVFDGVDLIAHWSRDPHQRALATHLVLTGHLEADQVADRVLSCVNPQHEPPDEGQMT